MNNSDDDDVGYKKPPKHSQFKPGKSGNPKGRPRKIKDPTRMLEIELDKVVTFGEGHKQVRMTKRAAFMTALVNDGITGKNHSRRLLLALLNMSKPPMPFEMSVDDVDDLKRQAREFLEGETKDAEDEEGE